MLQFYYKDSKESSGLEILRKVFENHLNDYICLAERSKIYTSYF